MLKEAIEKIVSLAGPTIQAVGDQVYSNQEMCEIRPVIDLPETQSLTSLDAVAKLIKTEAVTLYSPPFYITVPSFNKVKCFTQTDKEKRFLRKMLYAADAVDVPGWGTEEKLTFDRAAVALQTRFQHTDDVTYALGLLSQITCGGKITYNDNGIATSVVTQKGIALQENAPIRPLVTLKPYRTFQEVDQPESLFLIRIDERGISFIEADGGMWKLKARQTIKKYFETELSDLIEKGIVVVTV